MGELAVGLPRRTIEEFTTQELVDALKARKETTFSHVSSSASISLSVNGPVDVLVVKHHA